MMKALLDKYGPVPNSFTFGDGIDWNSSIEVVQLYVELPFWVMVPHGEVSVNWCDVNFAVTVCPPWMEVFVHEMTDSRQTCVHQGPLREEWLPPEDVAVKLEGVSIMRRPSKTVLRIPARAHAGAFRPLAESDPPRARAEQETYYASLCEAQIPVINEFIQRYRLTSYDYFAYEVSSWDVPIWHLKYNDDGHVVNLQPCKAWDYKPVAVEEDDANPKSPRVAVFEWAKLETLSAGSSGDATPGEFDLLDSRSLIERGDYTGAVRRTVTAIEAVLGWALLGELGKLYSEVEAGERLERTKNDFPGRLAQWRKLSSSSITQGEFDRFEVTRKIRHEIVHRGRRLSYQERHLAQRAVEGGRWLYNKLEAKPARATLRESGSSLKSVGRAMTAIRFPVTVSERGFLVQSFRSIDKTP